MIRRLLIKLFERAGWVKKRHGAGHDIYTNGSVTESIPRHADIPESLARDLIRKHHLKEEV